MSEAVFSLFFKPELDSLPHFDLKLLRIIVKDIAKDGKCTKTRKDLEHKANMCPSRCASAINNLVRRGIISQSKDPVKKSKYIYTLGVSI